MFGRFALIALSLALGSGCKKTESNPLTAPDLPKAAIADAAVPLAEAPAPDTKEYVIDNTASRLAFVGSNVTTTQEGKFEVFGGSVKVKGTDPTSASASVQIQMDSLKVGPDGLNKHLRSADFFDVAKYPQARFETTSIKPGGERGATHTVVGNLELRGTKKSISFPASIAITEQKAKLVAKFLLDRQAFGVAYTGKADNLVRDVVTVDLDLVASPK